MQEVELRDIENLDHGAAGALTIGIPAGFDELVTRK